MNFSALREVLAAKGNAAALTTKNHATAPVLISLAIPKTVDHAGILYVSPSIISVQS